MWEENDEKLGFSGLYIGFGGMASFVYAPLPPLIKRGRKLPWLRGIGFDGLASVLFSRFARNHKNRVKSYKIFFLIRGMVAALKILQNL